MSTHGKLTANEEKFPEFLLKFKINVYFCRCIVSAVHVMVISGRKKDAVQDIVGIKRRTRVLLSNDV